MGENLLQVACRYSTSVLPKQKGTRRTGAVFLSTSLTEPRANSRTTNGRALFPRRNGPSSGQWFRRQPSKGSTKPNARRQKRILAPVQSTRRQARLHSHRFHTRSA